MLMAAFLKKYGVLSVLCTTCLAYADQVGLIGANGGAASISSAGVVTLLDATANISSVAMNSSGLGLIAGRARGGTYAAFVSSTGAVTPLAINPTTVVLRSVAINASGEGLIG